jgi:phosphoglycolate phosphatase
MTLFPGVVEGLEELQRAGYLLAIATGKSRRGLERALDQMQVRRFFTASRCADEGYSKPHPGMLQAVMDELCVPARATLMIGDTTHDLEMAINAGVRGVGVAYGAHPKPQLLAAKPLACLDTPSDLFAWLNAQT